MSKVVVRDLGWRKVQRAIRAADGATVKVGVLGGSGSGGIDLVSIAVWNEFGTENGHVPSRPFMRTASDQNREKAGRLMSGLATRVITGQMALGLAMGTIGEWFRGRVQATIRNSPSWALPNAASTIQAKGSSTPLIDTGRLRQSIQWERTK